MKEINILSLVRHNVKRLKPYSSARDDFQGSAFVFLDANENPFPTPYNRYPDPHQHLLKEVVALLKNVQPDSIFLGNGSDEAIDLLFRVFCEPGHDSVLIPQPTYGMYAVCAHVNDVTVIAPSLSHLFALDAQAILNAVQGNTKLIFLCSPNNPSGNLLDEDQIEIILRSFSGLVVIDEAYIDFARSKGWATRLLEFQNLVILQTLSKAWGLAGLRLGMCFAHPEIIALINKIKPPYNINTFTQQEAMKTLQLGKARHDDMVDAILRERETLSKNLIGLPIVRKIHPSHANFILVEVTDATHQYDQLVGKGVIVRDRSSVSLCANCLRITVGTREENHLLIQAMRLL